DREGGTAAEEVVPAALVAFAEAGGLNGLGVEFLQRGVGLAVVFVGRVADAPALGYFAAQAAGLEVPAGGLSFREVGDEAALGPLHHFEGAGADAGFLAAGGVAAVVAECDAAALGQFFDGLAEIQALLGHHEVDHVAESAAAETLVELALGRH